MLFRLDLGWWSYKWSFSQWRSAPFWRNCSGLLNISASYSCTVIYRSWISGIHFSSSADFILSSNFGRTWFCAIRATMLKGDNKGALRTKDHSRSKHINIKHHFIRDCVKEVTIKLEYVSTRVSISWYIYETVEPFENFFFSRKATYSSQGGGGSDM